jgi:HrpA-like RNA helicase
MIATIPILGKSLVFLTGQNEIDLAMRRLDDLLDELQPDDICSNIRNLVAYPIYSALDTYEQRAIFTPPPPGTRKVVFATNIAQTSVTIPGIRYVEFQWRLLAFSSVVEFESLDRERLDRYVIDSGFVKQKMYNPQTSMDALLVVPISQAAATQRAGRAGR